MNQVLDGGPYSGRALLLKVMPDCFLFDEMEICKVPLWLELNPPQAALLKEVYQRSLS